MTNYICLPSGYKSVATWSSETHRIISVFNFDPTCVAILDLPEKNTTKFLFHTKNIHPEKKKYGVQVIPESWQEVISCCSLHVADFGLTGDSSPPPALVSFQSKHPLSDFLVKDKIVTFPASLFSLHRHSGQKEEVDTLTHIDM